MLEGLRPHLPLEIGLMAGSFVQLGWWEFGNGRCSRAESLSLTARDRAAILAAIPPGVDREIMLRATETEPLVMMSMAIV